MNKAGVMVLSLLVTGTLLSNGSAEVTATTAGVPAWFLHDAKIASGAHFPVKTRTYGLWLTGKPFNVYKEWLGSFTGMHKTSGYAYYWGKFNMAQYYKSLRRSYKGMIVTPIMSIYVLEKQLSGWGKLVHAEAVDIGNGGFLAFSDGQVITNTLHAGVDGYTVFPIEGIHIP